MTRLGALLRPRRRRVATLALVAACAVTGGCRRGGAGEPKAHLGALACEGCNLVVISLTSLRRDHVGLYGYGRPTTPNVDHFFRDGVIFDNAFANASWTAPAAASLFTAQYPTTHGVMDRFPGTRLRDEAVTLAEVLAGRGYATAAFTGGGDYDRRHGLDQGFQLYVDDQNRAELSGEPRAAPPGGPPRFGSAAGLVPAATRWLEAQRSRRFFMLLQGYDVHCPFVPRAPFDRQFDPGYHSDIDWSTCLWTFGQTAPVEHQGHRGYWTKAFYTPAKGLQDVFLPEREVQHLVARYDGAIAQADAALAPLLQTITSLGLARKTIVVFMSEHGDLLGEHGRFMRGGQLLGTFYDPVLRMPLVMNVPGAPKGQRVAARVQGVDWLPTLLDLLGVRDPAAKTRQGRSVAGVLRAPGAEPNASVYAAGRVAACALPVSPGLSAVEVVRDGTWKLIVEDFFGPSDVTHGRRRRELYDVARDPGETTNVAAAHPAVVADLEQRLARRFPGGLAGEWHGCGGPGAPPGAMGPYPASRPAVEGRR